MYDGVIHSYSQKEMRDYQPQFVGNGQIQNDCIQYVDCNNAGSGKEENYQEGNSGDIKDFNLTIVNSNIIRTVQFKDKRHC
jgi:hypothetical protein